MKIRDLNPRFPVVAQAIYPNKTLSENIRNIPGIKKFIEKHEAQGAHWVVFTWEDHAEKKDSWIIAVEKRLSIGFTRNMQTDDQAEEAHRG